MSRCICRLIRWGLLACLLLSLTSCEQGPTAGSTSAAASPHQPAPTSEPSPLPLPSSLLVYEHGGNLWAYDGTASRPLTGDGRSYHPLLSPNGRFLLFRRREPSSEMSSSLFSLWVLDLETNQELQLDLSVLRALPLELEGETVDLPTLPFQEAWLPDGRTLLFNTYVDFSMVGPGGSVPQDDLWLADVTTGHVRNLFTGEGQAARFTLSPDGAWLLLSRPSSIEGLYLDTLAWSTLLVFPPVATYSEYNWLPEPCWLPDGRHAQVAIAPAEPTLGAEYGLWRLDVESGVAEKIGQVRGSVFAWSPNGRSWSPDGSQLLYVEDVQRVVLADATGNELQEIARGEGPAIWGWAPDGHVALYREGQALYGITAGPQAELQALGQVALPAMDQVLWYEDRLLAAVDGRLLQVALDGSGVQEMEP